ncbi:MAG TPA: diacylglycerol kinase [Pirellulaceae bacterium]|nr:diacylglycerol kinase [Pirellulaceae bacterium]
MPDEPSRPFRRRPWDLRRKFADAFRGIVVGMQGQSSFGVHFLAAVVVVIAGALLECERWEWIALAAAIGIVFVAELFNSAFESLARAITPEENERVRDALDMAAGAVFLASLVAAAMGAIVFVPKLVAIFWPAA